MNKTKQDIYLSVIIPAYNESKRIGKTLETITEYLKKQPYSYELVIVNDGSKDNTSEVVNGLKETIPNVNFIDRKENKGKGYTVKEGLQKANGRIRLFTDADNSTDISHFEKMRPLFDQGHDVVIGSRNPKDAEGAGQAVSQPFHKRIMGMAGNLIIQTMAVPGIWDTQAGFKAFRDHAAEKIFNKVTIFGWGFDIEVLAIARKLDYKIGIVALHWINDPESHVGLSGYIEVLLQTFKIRWNLWRKKYD